MKKFISLVIYVVPIIYLMTVAYDPQTSIATYFFGVFIGAIMFYLDSKEEKL